MAQNHTHTHTYRPRHRQTQTRTRTHPEVNSTSEIILRFVGHLSSLPPLGERRVWLSKGTACQNVTVSRHRLGDRKTSAGGIFACLLPTNSSWTGQTVPPGDAAWTSAEVKQSLFFFTITTPHGVCDSILEKKGIPA